MTDPRVHWRRRLTAWLGAALLGAAGALSVVTPAHATDGTCTVTVTSTTWPTSGGQPGWIVQGTMTNTGTVNSTNWVLGLHFPSGAVISDYWNVTKSPVYAFAWYPVAWNKVIPPGQSANFGLMVLMPTWDVAPLPTSNKCGINY